MTGDPGCAWFGDRAVSVPARDPQARRVLADVLGGALPDCEVRHGMVELLVVARTPDAGLLDRVAVACADAGRVERVDARAASIRIPVRYDGSDLEDAASALGISVETLVAAHGEQAWLVAMVGFAPGFGYLVPEGEPVVEWGQLPRRSTPRSRVPAGSVAIAAGMSAVYPAAMPGGWHLIGTTGVRLFDPADEVRPSLLAPGDRVHFVVDAS